MNKGNMPTKVFMSLLKCPKPKFISIFSGASPEKIMVEPRYCGTNDLSSMLLFANGIKLTVRAETHAKRKQLLG
jgi:hypothetical protein